MPTSILRMPAHLGGARARAAGEAGTIPTSSAASAAPVVRRRNMSPPLLVAVDGAGPWHETLFELSDDPSENDSEYSEGHDWNEHAVDPIGPRPRDEE